MLKMNSYVERRKSALFALGYYEIKNENSKECRKKIPCNWFWQDSKGIGKKESQKLPQVCLSKKKA